jgi:hypothetical protein
MTGASEHYWNPMVPELTVMQFAVSLDFYRLVGFQVRFERTSPNFAYLTLGQAHLMIEEYHDTGWHVGALERPFGRGVNLQIEVADVQVVADTLCAHAISLYRPVTEMRYAIAPGVEEVVRECLVQDPDGYLLRFQEYVGQRSVAP